MFRRVIVSIFILSFIFLLIRLFAVDVYETVSDSMAQTIKEGDVLFVSKMPISLARNDIVVFKDARVKSNIAEFIVKRCVGLPGEHIQILNGEITIDDGRIEVPKKVQFEFSFISPDVRLDLIKNYGIDEIYYRNGEYRFHSVLGAIANIERHVGKTTKVYNKKLDAMEKTYIPQKGDTIQLNSLNFNLFRLCLELQYPDGKFYRIGNDVYLDDKMLHSFVIENDCFFMVGDNRHLSQDSRSVGFIPADFIEGKVLFWL